MISAFLLLLAQDVPAPAATADDAVVEGEEIVVRATYGTTTMLFDKTADGRLLNCRIMVSSGSQRRDTNACQATPVCYEKTADEVTDCVELAAIVPERMVRPPTQSEKIASDGPQVFDMPKLVQPKSLPPPDALGPIERIDEEANERQRVKKLPPVPKDESNGPVIRISNAQDK